MADGDMPSLGVWTVILAEPAEVIKLDGTVA